ncbi:MAG TPA: dethiobiotin synthase [Casimicrobiaceae bacterium]|nr:dethiobiotin synthase [Casimicrobiaceae bacterium]
MAHGVFVTGTDTGVGKTFASAALLRALVARGVRSIGMKPVASGIEPGARSNSDVGELDAASNVEAPLRDRNPYCFEPAIAPHVAAAQAGVRIDLDVIAAAYGRLCMRAQAIVVEGAGGAMVPLDDHADMLDIPARLELPVVLVVGMRLGCINHAMLSGLALRNRGLRFAGWVANHVDPEMQQTEASLCTLEQRLRAPLLARIGWGSIADFDAEALAAMGFPSSGA